VVVLGPAGAGKTTLTRQLAERLDAAPVVLDDIWRPDWDRSDLERFRVLLREAHAGEAWVSDGNFAIASFDIRLPPADLVIWIERPRWLCALRAMRRVWRPGEPHRPADLWKVLKFIWNFERVNRPRIEAERLKHAPKTPVLSLTSDREVAAFLDQAQR
jgi:adenylate kinase family enzyme